MLAYLVRIAADARYTLKTEVKNIARIAGLFEERYDKAPETTVYVQTDAVPLGKFRQSGYIVHVSIWEVHSRADNLARTGKKKAVLRFWDKSRKEGKERYHDRVGVSGQNRFVSSTTLLRNSNNVVHLHCTLHPPNVYFARLKVDRYSVDLDLQVCSSLIEGCMSRNRHDP